MLPHANSEDYQIGPMLFHLDEQADQSPCWMHMSFIGFVVLWFSFEALYDIGFSLLLIVYASDSNLKRHKTKRT